MKNSFFIVGSLFIIAQSCGKPATEDTETGYAIIKEYYSNGIIKSETSSLGSLRQGPTRNYDQQGRLVSEVNYVNNIREGTAKNYYAGSGKLNSTIEYKNGIKEGDEIWYYESGSNYRVSPFVNGKLEGIQKVFYENGQLMAEIPYKGGFPGIGLKEYKENGSLISGYPKVIIEKMDHLKDANKILLIVHLSGNQEEVKFYKGQLEEGKYLSNSLLVLASQLGSAQIDFNIPPGALLNQTLVISANYKTPYGNPYVVSKTYNLQVINTR